MIFTKPIPFCEKTTLPNGIKILSEKMETMRSVAVGIIVEAGSGFESEEESGISHFIEHMTFKGTKTRDAFRIARELDEVGGKINAYTSKENTVYYAVIIDEHIDIAIDMLADIFLNSIFDEKEIELEKMVVLEEIKMYEDTPDELIHDLFAETILHGHPMGKTTLGKMATVKAFKRENILEYRKRFYSPDNLIIAVAGNIDHPIVVKKIEKYFKDFSGKRVKLSLPPPIIKSEIKIKTKKTEQVHLCLGVKGVSQLDENRYPFSILDNIIGGSMSSRLFQEIREKRGLAYSIFSTSSTFRDFGIFYVYAGASKENFKKVIDLILTEFSNIKRNGISREELQRAKDFHKGTLVLSLEGTSSRMSWAARSEFYYGRVLTIDEIFAKIDKVTQDDIIRLANEYFLDEYLTLTTIGDFKEGELPGVELRIP